METLKINQIRVTDEDNRNYSSNDIIESVKKEGILVPLLVYEDSNVGDYVLIAGHRRLASAKHFKLKEVPVHILSRDQAETARALENLDRKQLHPLDEAREIGKLQTKGYDNNLIALMLGMDIRKVPRRAKLNNLAPEIKEKLLKNELSVESAEEYSIMDPEVQQQVYKRLEHVWNCQPRQVRSAYLETLGLSLANCSKEFLSYAPGCKGCQNNVASDSLLFDEADRVCKSPACYCEKLRLLMMENNILSVYTSKYNDNKNTEAALKSQKIDFEKVDDSWSYWEKCDKNHPVKVMDIYGNVKYKAAKVVKPELPKEEKKRRQEISKEYKGLYAQLPELLKKMVFEHADAYMSKYHKDERFPDSDERMVLVRNILKGGEWRLGAFIQGKGTWGDKYLEGEDNKRIFGVVYLYCATGGEENKEVAPNKVETGGTLVFPNSIDIEDMFQLRTSKTRKKVMEIKKQMEALLAEYNGVSNGTDD